MAEDEDYELLPHREIQRLKEEISKLKGGTFAESDKGLKRAVTELAEKIESMNEILESASEDLREEDKQSEIIKDKIDPIIQKLAQMAEQNEKIARGLVAINDILDEKMTELSGVLGQFRDMAADIKDIKLDLKHAKVQKAESARPATRAPPFGLELGVPPGSAVPPPPLPGGPQRMEPRKRGLFG